MAVLELRQYILAPGRRDELIDLFEAELLAPQEQLGMEILGTFRDLEDEQRFVWIRSFADMARRASSLAAFYGGPVWRRHRDAANATMIESDNVLLLRPAWPGSSFSPLAPPGSDRAERTAIQVGIVPLCKPVDDGGLTYFVDEIEPLVKRAGATMLACLVSEHAVNSFPALPVREGENVLVWFAGLPGLDPSSAVHGLPSIKPAARAWPGIAGEPEIRILAPTRHSRLTGSCDTRFTSLRLAPSSA